MLASRCVGFTRAEIGKRLGLSAERVRQIGQKALQTVEELYRVNSELRLAINAPRLLFRADGSRTVGGAGTSALDETSGRTATAGDSWRPRLAHIASRLIGRMR